MYFCKKVKEMHQIVYCISVETSYTKYCYFEARGGTPILDHIRDVRPEWVSFPGQKPADGCKFLNKNLRMGHNFNIILPGNGWFSSKLKKKLL